jgi:hypothetical protein
MTAAPLQFRYEGDGQFVAAAPYFARRADQAYVVGQTYKMAEQYDRSAASHAHQFAWLHDAWLSLPERYRNEPWAQTSEHLRKYALIRTGYCRHADLRLRHPCRGRALGAEPPPDRRVQHRRQSRGPPCSASPRSRSPTGRWAASASTRAKRRSSTSSPRCWKSTRPRWRSRRQHDPRLRRSPPSYSLRPQLREEEAPPHP